mgnify:CR=1 FL=1
MLYFFNNVDNRLITNPLYYRIPSRCLLLTEKRNVKTDLQCRSNSKEKSKFLRKNRNFGEKSIFWRKINISDKNQNLRENFGEKTIFWRKINISDKNQNFGEKSKFWRKITILEKNQNFGDKKGMHYLTRNLCFTYGSEIELD